MKTKPLIVGLVIAVLAFYFTFRNVTLKEFVDSFATVEYVYLIPMVFLTAVTYVARVYRWRLLLVPLKDMRASQLYSPLMVGFMGNLLPARAGEFIRAYLVGTQHNISISGSFATVVVERGFDTLIVLGMFGWLLAFHSDIFSSEVQWSGISLEDLAFNFGLLALGLVAVLFAFVYLMLFQRSHVTRLVQWVVKPLSRKWHEKIEDLVEQFSEGLMSVRDVRLLVKIFLYSLLVWALILASYYCLYWAYDLQDKSVASVVMVVLMICIFISAFPTPGFVGSFQAGILVGLHGIMQEAEVAAVSFGMMAWGINVAVMSLGGVYFILHERLSVRQLVEAEKEA